MPLNRFSEKHVCDQNFLQNRTTISIWAKRTIWCVWGQNYFARKLRSTLPRKAPKSYFWKARFRYEFFYYTTPQYLSGPNRLHGTIGGKIVPERSFVSLKKHDYVLNFFTKPPPHLFLGPNRPFGAFGGKTISHENFAPFCLVSPQNRFSEKHVSGPNFFT